MTGTGKVAEKELIETYNMSVVRIPTNRPRQRIDYPDNLYVTYRKKCMRLWSISRNTMLREIPCSFL